MSNMSTRIFGLLFERLCAAIGLIALSPLLIIAGILILVEDGGPILFRQKRIGHRGKPFEVWKFRSMRRQNGGPAITAAGDGRILRTGRYLRRYKIDELPQLWNVVRGQMRLVGPRPEVPPFVDCSVAIWQRVLAVPPGITDLATLVYRNEEELLACAENPEQFYREQVLPAKLHLNLKYLNQRAFSTDAKLVLTTVWYCLFPARFSADRILVQFAGQDQK
jgi:lipopolysaccharide/colanic/teichoic acid biosynthesis glycosyltransferase